MPRSHPIEDYRNFGIMARIDAGGLGGKIVLLPWPRA